MKKNKPKYKKEYLYAGIAVFFWSTVASAFKLGLRTLDHLQFLFYASITSTIILFLVILIQKKTDLLLQQSIREILRSAIAGLLNPFLYYLILFKAYTILPAQQAQPLNFTWPIALTLLSGIFLNQKLGGKTIIGLIISFFGVLVIATHGNLNVFQTQYLNGYILAVSSSLIWALYWIFNIKDDRDPILKLFIGFVFGSIYITIAQSISSNFIIPGVIGAICSIYAGIFEMGLTFVCWLKALSLSEKIASISQLVYISPFISLVFINVIIGEIIHVSSVIGLLFIIMGILLQSLNTKKMRQLDLT